MAHKTNWCGGAGKTGIGMQGGIVLDLRPLAELDPFIVAAQHRAEPDAGVNFEPDFPDQRGSRRDPIAPFFRKLGAYSVKFINHCNYPRSMRGVPLAARRIGN